MNFLISNKAFIFSIDALFVVVSLIVLIGALFSVSSVEDHKISQINTINQKTFSVASSAFYLNKTASDYHNISSAPSVVSPSSSVRCFLYSSVNKSTLGSSFFNNHKFCVVVGS